LTAAWLWSPPQGRRGDYGEEVAELAELYGRPLDAHQRESVDAITAYGAGGRWQTLEAGAIEPRQNGKTGGTMTAVTFADLFLAIGGPDKIIWTAHLFKTAMEAFADHKRLIEGTPELSARVKRVCNRGGEESIELTDGSLLAYLARSKGGGRGLGGKRVVIDEALFWTPDQASALLPTLAARPSPQILYGSSACLADERSDYLRSLVARGRSGADPSLTWVEYCAPGSWDDPGCDQGAVCSHRPGVPGCVMDDVDLWREANRAMGEGRIALSTMRAFRRGMDPEAFGREFLGWHESGEGGHSSPVSEAAWSRCGDLTSAIEGRPVFGVAVSRDGRSAAIAAAGRRADGLQHVETVAYATGDVWVVDRAAELRASQRPRGWALDVKTAAAALLPALAEKRIRPSQIGTSECGQASASLLSKILAGTVRHRGAHDPDLQRAALGARRRDIGPGLWTWAGKSSEVDTVALEAATFALWQLDQTPRAVPMVARR
jgi:hypothetical protein